MNPLEKHEAAALTAWLRIKGLKFHHSPNETGHTPEARRRAIRMKREGTSPGFPDYLVITPSGLVAIELKRVKGSVVSPEQKEWVAALNAIPGIAAVVARGADEAKKVIESYL